MRSPRGDLALFAGLDVAQLAAQIADSFFDQPAVDFELLFARAAHADAHLDSRQVGPHRFSRGSEYCNWASSTARRDSWCGPARRKCRGSIRCDPAP